MTQGSPHPPPSAVEPRVGTPGAVKRKRACRAPSEEDRPRGSPPPSDPEWLKEALWYARSPFERAILLGDIPLSLKGTCFGDWRQGGPLSEKQGRGFSLLRQERVCLKELLDFLYVRAEIPLSVAVKDKRKFVLVIGVLPFDMPPDVRPGVCTSRFPSMGWCPYSLFQDLDTAAKVHLLLPVRMPPRNLCNTPTPPTGLFSLRAAVLDPAIRHGIIRLRRKRGFVPPNVDIDAGIP